MVGRLPFFRNKNLSQSPVFLNRPNLPGKRVTQSRNCWRAFFSDNRAQIRFSQMQNLTMILLLFVGQEPIDAGDFRLFRR
jgi:hypothetical protein